MMKIDIIGRGNVGSHLAAAFGKLADIREINPRTLEGARGDSDLSLLCVSDSAIREVARQLKPRLGCNTVLAHTSGTTPLDAVGDVHAHAGVMYPLQTFTKGKELDYSRIPFFIEGSDRTASETIESAAKLISGNVTETDSDTRRHLHLAGVMACNFANHLWALSDEYLRAHGLRFDMLVPLLGETLRKAEMVSPLLGQTGPAARNDRATIGKHIGMLDANPDMQEIYRLLTDSIISYNNERDKLRP